MAWATEAQAQHHALRGPGVRPQLCPNTAAFSCLTKPARLVAAHPPSQATSLSLDLQVSQRPAPQTPYAVQELGPPPPPL